VGKYILRRLLLLIPILFGLTILVFLFIRALPGDPAAAILGERATPEAIERVRTALGLDRPLIDQYLAYMGGIIRLDFGTSFITNRDVTDDFLQRFPATVELTFAAMLFAISLGIPLGLWTAKRGGTWIDSGGTIFALIGISIPIFFLGLMLKYMFAIQWPILPDSGRIDLIEYPQAVRDKLKVVGLFAAGDLVELLDALDDGRRVRRRKARGCRQSGDAGDECSARNVTFPRHTLLLSDRATLEYMSERRWSVCWMVGS